MPLRRRVAPMSAYSPALAELRRDIDHVLLGFLGSRRSELSESALLVGEIERIIRAGGKRVRPLFCYWGYRAAGAGHAEAIVEAAAALELLHTFALIHDDVMDASAERRGVPSVHASHDVSTAILAGDLALVLADDLLMSAKFPPETAAAAFHVYSRMRREVIAGQFLDVRSAQEQIDEATARRIAVLKSGRYSVMEPLLVGATLGGAGAGIRDALASFGEPLGEAFQLRDDVLGLFGDAAVTGKPVDSDIRQGKRHLLFAKTVRSLGDGERDFFLARWGAVDLTDAEIGRLRGLVETSGAHTEVEHLIAELHGSALAALSAITDAEAPAALEELATLIVARDS